MRRSLSVLLVLSAQLGNVVRCQAAAPKRPSEAPALREEAGPVEILRLLYGNYDSANVRNYRMLPLDLLKRR